ncbi:MAG TPA: nuclear transport factor 2 family protein [Acidimicrobiales bacterium]|jgi:ketosteroid isomerase-like protein|nr:nuclear transport factor 2 family protein [Acidimicrobiales bacterium]
MTTTTSTQTDQLTTKEALSLAVAGRLIDRLAARDFDAVVGTLTDDVTFRALLPSRVLDLNSRDAVRSALETWFGGAERWDLVEAVVGEVGGRVHLRWRLRLTNPEVGPGTFLVEQQVYADAGPDGRLRDVALLCTGYRPDAG